MRMTGDGSYQVVGNVCRALPEVDLSCSGAGAVQHHNHV